MRAIVILTAALAFCGCSLYVPGPHPLLIVPDGFRGEVFLVGDKEKGSAWVGSPLLVPASGVLLISNLKELATIRPDAYDARYVSGRRLENRNRGGSWDVDGLWPVTVIRNDQHTDLIYFVVGTFDTKTDFDNARMRGDWKATLEAFRSGRRPNQ